MQATLLHKGRVEGVLLAAATIRARENRCSPAACMHRPALTTSPASPYIRSLQQIRHSHRCSLFLSNMKMPLLLLIAIVVVSLSRGNGEQTDLTRETFPAGFVFGTASSAYQVEGNALKYGRGPCIWDTFLMQPGEIDDACSGKTSNVVSKYTDHKQFVAFFR